MKQLSLFLLGVLLFCTACQRVENEQVNSEVETTEDASNSELMESESEVIEISEKYFMLQIDDIYYNFDEYEGKKVKVQGMYEVYEVDENHIYHTVFRYGPGCCGNDGWGGFHLKFEGEYPESNDWIEVVGTPEIVSDGATDYLYLNVESITVLDERGAEMVTQ